MDGMVVFYFMKTYLYKHCIPFQDTDMAGVVHYTRILGYVELAEHAYLSDLGIDAISNKGGLPKVHVECDYLFPLRFNDMVEVRLLLNKCSTKSLHWEFEITLKGKDFLEGKLCAKGKMITVYVNAQGEATNIPTEWFVLLA